MNLLSAQMTTMLQLVTYRKIYWSQKKHLPLSLF